jgi:CHAT domain-containing protein
VRAAVLLAAVAAAGQLLCGASPVVAAPSGDFSLGVNTERQTCRAVARFDAPRGAQAADIYCGPWERPSGRITLYQSQNDASAALTALCPGTATTLQSADFTELRQIACAEPGQGRVRRYALVARRGALAVLGEIYPSDWTPLMTAARVMTGAAKPGVSDAGASQTPGLDEIRAVFPSGPPGQGAEVNYELLRRRAYEYNLVWSFGASQRDFEELLRAHKRTAPDDAAGEAEILAEIGLNMSSARRFDAAADVFNRAETKARAAGDALLLTKITNYRSLDQLNQRRFAAALRLALAANQARADLARSDHGAGVKIDPSDVRQVENRASDVSHRSLLISLDDNNPADRATILSAQGFYLAGVAARGLGEQDDAARDLAQASSLLQEVDAPPSGLIGEIATERANLAIAGHDYAGAVKAAQAGLAAIHAVAPGTRSEAHMWLSLEAAQDALGQTPEALASGRTAMSIYAREGETPGLPADVASTHLRLLEREWRRTGDPKLASEYFEDLALVWDGAAARTTAQLAARLVLSTAGSEARAYQDAERSYRAAYAQRQALAEDPDAPQDQLAQADAAVRTAAGALTAAETALRSSAPSYLELLSPQLSTDDLRAVLADHEGYLRIAMASDGGFGALVVKAGVYPFLIAPTGGDVDALVDRLRRSTRLRGRRLPDFDVDAAAKLYAGLIAPARAQMADVQDLDVDVSGSLASAPFGAFVASAPDAAQLQNIKTTQDYTGVDWLARHVSIANTLGPAAFVRLRKQPSPPSADLHAAIYGDYQPDPTTMAERIARQESLSEACQRQVERALAALGALPETADEARSVAASFVSPHVMLGAAFTDTDFMTSPETADADVIVLATHGVLALSSCFAEPALVASVGATGDGLIEASHLLDRRLKARLVVLSACDTAAGGNLDEARTGLADGGDALSGLARAFIYAGARNVLATEWKVDAAASGAEITDLLASANRPGVTLRSALSSAQSKLYSQAETAHPFFWAPFVLVGDGGGVLKATQQVAAAPTQAQVAGR